MGSPRQRIINSDQLDASIPSSGLLQDLTSGTQSIRIVVFTISGASAMWMSKAKPSVPIYAFTPETSIPMVGIAWGVTRLLVPARRHVGNHDPAR